MKLFKGSKNRTPSELVKHMKEQFVLLEKDPNNSKNSQKAVEEISKDLQSTKFVLYGDSEHEPSPEQIALLCQEVFNSGVISLLLTQLHRLEFEAKKDAATIFANLLRRQTREGRFLVQEYMAANLALLPVLVLGYENPDVALNSGAILRECIKHEPLAAHVFADASFWKFFGFVEMPHFDAASDAFATFKELLTKHKTLSAEFLDKNYGEFFEHYTALLKSNNYVTKRQSLKLLGELLLDRANFNVMTKYIANADNLKLMMQLLKDKSKSTQFEAFHVFKVFVANPNKQKPILDILCKNKERLISFLGTFHADREDEQFNEEKQFLLKQIQALP